MPFIIGIIIGRFFVFLFTSIMRSAWYLAIGIYQLLKIIFKGFCGFCKAVVNSGYGTHKI